MPANNEAGLDTFWKLSDPKEKLRIDAAFKIISNLNRQKKLNDETFEENFDYAVQRFVTGLASDRTHARKGYFTGLVQILKTFPDNVTIAKVLDIVERKFNTKGSKSVCND